MCVLQEMKRADAFLDRALYNAEDIDMDAVFLAIDAYRNAILLTRYSTPECIHFEAMVLPLPAFIYGACTSACA